MKVAVIGGGSTYTPELVNGFLQRVGTFPLTELWLMDIDAERLRVVGGFAKRMVDSAGAPFEVHLTTERREALRDANYVTTQLRVGMMPARRNDEYLGRRHGLIGQETTGVGGMAKALRTIPIILEVANEMRELAPHAMLANFTNPAGLVTQALSQIDPSRGQLNTLGLNHLSWHRGFTVDGEDVWNTILADTIAELRQEADPEWEPRLIESLCVVPNYYLQYFYYTARKLADQEQWPPSRAEQVQEIEKGLLAQYADPNVTDMPADLMKRGGAYYSTVATQLLNAHYNDLNEIHVVNVKHDGAVKEYPAGWVLEMPCNVNREGVHPIATDPLPDACFGLLAQVKSYELLTVQAAVHGDREAAYQALITNPLGPKPDKAQAVLDDLLETNREYLPQFWK
jgi:6-phospho-beta-glucosidase